MTLTWNRVFLHCGITSFTQVKIWVHRKNQLQLNDHWQLGAEENPEGGRDKVVDSYLQIFTLLTAPYTARNSVHCNTHIYRTDLGAYFYIHINNNRGCWGWKRHLTPTGNESCQTEESPRCYLSLVAARWASTLSHILWVTRLTAWQPEGKDHHYTALQHVFVFVITKATESWVHREISHFGRSPKYLSLTQLNCRHKCN